MRTFYATNNQAMKKPSNSRRSFIKSVGVTAGIIATVPSFGFPSIIRNYNKSFSIINGVKFGVITYSFRSLPDQSAEATLQYIKDSGISYVELMGDPAETYAGKPENPVDFRQVWPLFRAQREGTITEDQEKELAEARAQMEAYAKEVAQWRASASMDKFKEVRKMYNDAGVEIYGFKPNAFGENNTDAEITFGMKAARELGASHVTLEHPGNDAHTLKLGQMGAENKMNVAYHGHEQQTPTFWDTALDQSKFNRMNIDIGHYVAAGNSDPLGILKEKNQYISSMHVKDRQTPENGKGNVKWGTGDTPIVEVVQLMAKEKYKFPATVELEYDIPEGSDAVSEVKNCLEYCRKALS